MSTRSQKNHHVYENYRKQIKSLSSCHFCDFKNSDSSQVLATYKGFWVVKNIFPYDLWDQCGVEDHLMIVPKRHTDTLSHLTPKEQAEYMKIVSEYESRGYSVYSRAPANIRKSVVHQHTHLIKLDNRPKNFVLYSKRLRHILIAK